MKTLLFYEIKKIISRKSTWAAFLILLSIQGFLAFSANLGSDSVNGIQVETHAQRNVTDRKNGLILSGRKIDDTLLTEMQQAYKEFAKEPPITESREYLLSEEYQENVRPYSAIYTMLNWWLSASPTLSPMDVTEKELMDFRQQQVQAEWDTWNLSEKERSYWTKKEEKLPKTFSYQYATAYEQLISMQGEYMVSLLITFFIAISMVGIFEEETHCRTDQLILCTPLGKKQLYFIKILAGTVITFAATAVFALLSLLGNFICFGPEGFNAMLQTNVTYTSSLNLTTGEVFLIMLAILLLSSVLIGILAMLLAHFLHNSIGAMGILLGLLFAARLIQIPDSFGILSRLWNLLPINLLKLDQGFTDVRLFSFGNISLTTWQLAPVLYLLLAGIIILAGKRRYSQSEIKGR